MTTYTWVVAFPGGAPNLAGDFDDPNNSSIPGTNGNVITPAGPPGPGDAAIIDNLGGPPITVTCTGQTVAIVEGGTLVGAGDDEVSLTVTDSLSGSTITDGAFEVDDAFDVVVNGGSFTADTARDATFNGGTISIGSFADDSGITIDGASVSADNASADALNIELDSGSLDVADPLDLQGFAEADSIFLSGGKLTGDDATLGGAIDPEGGGEGEADLEIVADGAAKLTGQTDVVDGYISVGEPVLGYDGKTDGGSLTLSALAVTGDGGGLAVGNGATATIGGDATVDTTTLFQGTVPDDGTVAVDGKDSSLTIDGVLVLGFSADGNGSASATNGAEMNASGGLAVAVSGNADFNVENATVTVGGIYGVAGESGSVGTVELTNSRMDVTGHAPIIFGGEGQATINQTNGGLLTDSKLIIGAAGSDDTYNISSTASHSLAPWFFDAIIIGTIEHGGDGDQLNDSNTVGWMRQQLVIAPEASMNVSGNSEINIGADSIFNIRPDHNTESYVVVSHQGKVLLGGTIKADWTVTAGVIEVGGYYDGSPVGSTGVIDGNLSGGYKYYLPGSPLSGRVLPDQVGLVAIDTDATLELTGGDAPTLRTAVAPIVFIGNGAGTLKLDSPSLFFGGMLNLAGGDKIILANVTAAAPPTLTPSKLGAGQYTLSVTDTSGKTYSYQTTLFAPEEGVAYAQVGADTVITIVGTARDTASGTAQGLSGATVSSTGGAATTTTDSTGGFTLDGGGGVVVVSDGTDTSTGLAFDGEFTAPYNSTVVTPLTTVLVALQAKTGETVSQAQPELLSAFGLDSILDLTTFDDALEAEQGEGESVAVFDAEAKVLDTAAIISSTLAGFGVGPIAGFNDAIAAIAAAIAALGSGATLDLSDDATLATLIGDAGTAAGKNLSAISGDVAQILAAVNAAVDQESRSGGSSFVFESYAIERVAQGVIGPNLRAAAGNPTDFAADVAKFTGNNLTSAIAGAASALTALGVTASAPPTPYADTADDILALTSDDLANIRATGFTGLTIDDSLADLTTLTSQQWSILRADETALGGKALVLADSDDDILTMTSQQAASLAADGVTSIAINDGGIDMPVALALDFAADKESVTSLNDDGIVVQDTGAHLESLTAAEITGLKTVGVMALAASDASPHFDAAQSAALEAADMTIAAPANDSASEAFADGSSVVFDFGADDQLATEVATGADGSEVVSTFNITGQNYTETVKSLDENGNKTSLEYEGMTGTPYDAIEYFFSGTAATGYTKSGWDLFYAGQTSGLTQIDFDGSGDLVEELYDFGGATNGKLATLEIDYVAGQQADSLYAYVGPGGSSFTRAVYEYGNENNYVGATYTFTGAPYDEIQASFTPGTSPKLTETTYSQYTGAGGPNDVSYFYSTAGVLAGVQETFTGITGQAYTSDVVLYDASGVAVASQYKGYATKPFSALTYFDNGSGAAQEIVRDYTSVAAGGSINGEVYDSYETIDNSSNVLLATAYHLDSGGNVYIGVASNETAPTFGGAGATPNAAELAYALPGGDWTITGGGTNERFSFASLFNAATITDYGASVTAGKPDQITLAAADFDGWPTFLGEGAASGTGGADTTFTSTATGDKLTLDGVKLAQLSAMSADFNFV
jgi:hypothetical protein